MSATTPKAKLAPLTFTITDQRTLARIYKIANQRNWKPARLASTVLNCGLWDWLRNPR